MVFAIIAIILCSVAAVTDFITGHNGSAVFFCFLVLANCYGLKKSIEKMNNKDENIRTEIVTDVKGYQVDSTIVISNQDTTKTYVLTYWK